MILQTQATTIIKVTNGGSFFGEVCEIFNQFRVFQHNATYQCEQNVQADSYNATAYFDLHSKNLMVSAFIDDDDRIAFECSNEGDIVKQRTLVTNVHEEKVTPAYIARLLMQFFIECEEIDLGAV